MTALNTINQQLQSLEFAELKMISRRSESRATKVVRVLTDPVDKILLSVNGYWDKVTGYKSDEMVGRKWETIVPERYLLSANAKAVDVQEDGEFNKYVCPIVRKDGHEVAVTWYAKHLPAINRVIKIGHVSLKDYAQCIEWNKEL